MSFTQLLVATWMISSTDGTGHLQSIGVRLGACLDTVATLDTNGALRSVRSQQVDTTCQDASECSWIDIDYDKEYLYGYVQYDGCSDYLRGGISFYFADLETGDYIRRVDMFGSAKTNLIVRDLLTYNHVTDGVPDINPPRQILDFYAGNGQVLYIHYVTTGRDCPAGQYETSGTFFGYCLDCDAGRYSSSSGSTSCSLCPAGRFSSAGADGCTGAPALSPVTPPTIAGGGGGSSTGGSTSSAADLKIGLVVGACFFGIGVCCKIFGCGTTGAICETAGEETIKQAGGAPLQAEATESIDEKTEELAPQQPAVVELAAMSPP
mmetsp:Transcript_9529/g.38871  ORF Transcript_9529/g.38871 Transcript_9529/m.38871 type:complete len:322 (+) Transcript_9529:279-1244(+)|eukprot:CAMPEP_0185690496 /NCGR_PEP_ID=MMETSP1164-20130828/1153_1 /TAXON_ID=1104430 /ORGANISM="Chrysoreinhardia sp, Strain CCMP2950" /LENGTH=321 /DNA_ID=CAMNT_0028357067 /DNA_START=153 /DNA_END=1118 /DNA_ORIENTATION=-